MNLRGTLIAVACLALAISGRTAADEPQFLGRTKMQWIDSLEAGQRRQRSQAAWALQEFAVREVNDDNSLVWLNELLLLSENGSPSVRYWGAFGIGRFIGKLDAHVPARVKALEALPALLKDPYPAVRIAAADALLPASDRAAALAVLTQSLADPQEAVRIQAATALERWGELARPATATLRKATSDPSEYVKRIATRALEPLEAKTP